MLDAGIEEDKGSLEDRREETERQRDHVSPRQSPEASMKMRGCEAPEISTGSLPALSVFRWS